MEEIVVQLGPQRRKTEIIQKYCYTKLVSIKQISKGEETKVKSFWNYWNKR